MADTARARRLAKRIVAIVATELEHQVKDPRLAMTTITAATLTPDLRDATVFYTVYGDESERTATATALASATGVLRTAVGRETGVRFTPTLQFFADDPALLAEKLPEKREVARAAGYLRPDDFLAMFRYVREKAYEQKSFRDYVKAARS